MMNKALEFSNKFTGNWGKTIHLQYTISALFEVLEALNVHKKYNTMEKESADSKHYKQDEQEDEMTPDSDFISVN